MRRWTIRLLLVVLTVNAGVVPALGEGRAAEKRSKIDAMEAETLDRLLSDNAGAKRLHSKAYGHAVFSNVKISLLVTGGGGSGVAVGGGKSIN